MERRICIAMFVCLVILEVNISAQTIRVILLGTGTPQPSNERFGAATLVEAGGSYFLFDCGRGASLTFTIELLSKISMLVLRSVPPLATSQGR